MDLVFFLASTLRRQFAANASRRLNLWIQLWTMKRNVANVVIEESFMEKPCVILVILGLKGRVAKIDYYKWIL